MNDVCFNEPEKNKLKTTDLLSLNVIIPILTTSMIYNCIIKLPDATDAIPVLSINS